MSEAEKKWKEWDEKQTIGDYTMEGISASSNSREAYKATLRREIEKEIKRLTKKIDERTAPQSIGYIVQREQSKWFLKLLDTV